MSVASDASDLSLLMLSMSACDSDIETTVLLLRVELPIVRVCCCEELVMRFCRVSSVTSREAACTVSSNVNMMSPVFMSRLNAVSIGALLSSVKF